jgi:hypothetical protein
MEPLINPKNQSGTKLPNLVQDLNSNLSALKPDNSETTRIINYALIATAVVGIMVYHYIQENERAEDLKNYHG